MISKRNLERSCLRKKIKTNSIKISRNFMKRNRKN